MVLFISSAGIPLGITRYVSEWEKDGKWIEINEIVSKSIIILVIFGLFFLLLTIFFSKDISLLILGSDEYSTLLIIVAFAFPITLIVTILDAYLRGLKRFKQYVKINVIISILALVVCVILVIYYNIFGFAISLPIAALISLFVYLYYFNKDKLLRLKNLKLTNYSISGPFKSILKLGIASLILGISDQATILAIRSLIVKNMGIEFNGIYQCVAGISNNYLAIFFLSLGAYIIPVLSEMKDIDKMNYEINNAIRLTLLMVVPIITITFVLREYIILVLYSPNFLPSSDLMVYNFTGDFFKALSFVISSWLIPRSKIRLWLIFGVIYNINYFVIFILLNIFNIDLKNVVIAYAVTGFIHLFVNIFLIKKFNKFRFRLDTFKLSIISSSLLALIMICSSYKIVIGYYIIVPFLLIWIKYSIKKDEFYKLLSLIKLRT